jgi:adenine-specific DNA-methyltransferase
MFAMAYTSQGTGHYAQYRDAKTLKSLKDICIYRKKSIEPNFTRKIEELFLYGFNNRNKYKNEHWSLDFNDALENFKEGTVYADPPYCFVHYSRFYHALETLVLYDYPDIQTKNNEFVKGRYREKRHQSPFCIKTQVDNAFLNMFSLIAEKNSNLILSYSNTGMISLEKLADIAASIWDVSKIKIVTTNHQHMTLGRQGKRFRDVVECLFIVEA